MPIFVYDYLSGAVDYAIQGINEIENFVLRGLVRFVLLALGFIFLVGLVEMLLTDWVLVGEGLGVLLGILGFIELICQLGNYE